MKQRILTLLLCLVALFTTASAQDNYDATTMGTIERYYETAKWAQNSPFNNQCWTDATQQVHAKTGCVPTAFAIVMRHHGFPVEGIGELKNCQTDQVITDRTYDYSKMPLTNGSGWTAEQQNEVAKLMAHLGHAFGVTFGSGTTSVSIGKTMSERMQNFFNYNYAPVSNQYAGSGQMYDFEEWKRNLKNSLDNGCPVPYAADNKKDGKNDTRHMFVIDGYTANDYFHFNFGWGGTSNGWFKLDDITPTGDDYSWRTTSDGYDSKHQAYFNLMPNIATYEVTATANPATMGSVSINNGTVGSTATASLMNGATATLTAHPADGYALANWTKNDVVVGSRNTLEVKVGTDANDYVANFDDEANVLVVKEYTVNPANGSLSGGTSKCSTWTAADCPAGLKIKTKNSNDKAINSITEFEGGHKFYAGGLIEGTETSHTSPTTYTLSVDDGYIITGYHMTYYPSTANKVTLTNEYGYSNTPSSTKVDYVMEAVGLNTNSTTFTVAGTSSGYAVVTTEFTVTVANEGAGGGSTPTPVTYTIKASAGTGGSVKINGDAVSQKNVDENSTVTVVATPQTGYSFVNWTSGNNVVSTNATYSFTATANTTLVANFAKTAYTVAVEANEGGVAYIGTKGTTSTTVGYNDNVTLTAEANDGYEFVKWTDANGGQISTNATISVEVTTDVTYRAVFQSTEQPGEGTTESLVGKYFRLKEKSTGTYMNIYDNSDHGTQARGGVNVTTLNENSDAQIFQFIESGTNYKLLSKTGYYIYCQSWNVDAYSTTSANGTELTLEPTATELEYLINCAKGYFKIGPVDQNPSLGNFVYCNAAQADAATWVLEEVVYYTVTATAGNGGTANASATTVEHGSKVTLTATPNTGYEFVGWYNGETKVSEVANYEFAVTSNINYTANFKKITYNISVSATEGGTANASATTVEHGSKVTLTATPNTGYEFVGWYNGETKVSEVANYEFAVTSNINYTANFKKITYNISVSVNGTNGSAYIGNATTTQKEVAYGEQVTLTAAAGVGYHFVSWTKDGDVVEGADAEYTFVPTGAAAYTANFAINTYEINVSATEGGTANASATTVEHGSEVTLTATPEEGYEFVGWYNGETKVNEVANFEFAVTSDINYTANFKKKSYTVAASATEGGTASASAETVEHGSEVTLTAEANEGYEFAGWYNGETKVSDANPYTFTVTSDINYTARFNEVVVNPTTVAIHVTVASTDGTTVTNNATGNVKAIINNIGQEWATDADVAKNADVELVAVNDHNLNAYLFDGWYKNGVLVSNKLEITVQATEAATYEARFFRGCVVTGKSSNNRFGYISSITLADGTSIGYDAANRAVVKAGTTVSINTFFNMYGYEVASWIDAEGNVVGSGNNLVVEVNENVTYTANFEPASYTLIVRAINGGFSTVSATSGNSTGTSIKVGHNMEATITATPAQGYHFVSWTKGTEVVSEDVEYTIAGIADVENMVDVEYIANFEKNEVAEAGTYYRFAYEFDVPVETPANSAATRAAGETITISPSTGDVAAGGKACVWNYTENNNPAGLKIVATDASGNRVNAISVTTGNSPKLKFSAGGAIEGTETTSSAPTTFTLSVNEGYLITGYTMVYTASSASRVTISNTYGYSVTPTSRTEPQTMEKTGISEPFITFNVSAAASPASYAAQVNSFTVTIQKVGGEPETVKKTFYVQSEASENNAMVMKEAADAASIFYYADSKLLSYATGKFVKEEGTACGLQDYGIENAGNVTILKNGDDRTATIAAPSYLHANSNGTAYYVSNCGATATCPEHNFILEEVKALPVTITKAKYATFYAPVAVKIPEGVYAWYLLEDGIDTDKGYASMAEITGVIPAYTAVVIGSETTETTETYLFEIVDDPGYTITGNMLSGTVAAEYIPVSSTQQAYILSIVDGKVGLYKAKKNGPNESFLSLSHRAYLLLDTAQQSSGGFRLVFGTTAIEEVEAENNAEGIYDLSGRKLEGINGPGIYIVNGKKVLVK